MRIFEFIIFKNTLPKLAAVVSAQLEEIMLQDTTDCIHERNNGRDFFILLPQSCIRVFHRIYVHPFSWAVRIMLSPQSDGGAVFSFLDKIEGNEVIPVGMRISDLPVEIGIMSQNENLLDEVALHNRVAIICVVPADLNHLANLFTNDKERAAVHTGYRIVDDNDFLPSITLS